MLIGAGLVDHGFDEPVSPCSSGGWLIVSREDVYPERRERPFKCQPSMMRFPQYIFFTPILLPLLANCQDATSADRAVIKNTMQPSSTLKDRLAGRVLAVLGPSEPSHLTEHQRFHDYVSNAIGPLSILGEGVGAGIGQWANSPKEWGQGWGAYGKRFASNVGYNGIRQTISYGVATAFHEDDRYFSSHETGAWKRTKYALVSTFTARHPDGSNRFSISSFTGVLGAGTAASIWGPGSYKGIGNIATNAGISFGTTAAFNVFREFLPDLLHRPRK